MEQAQQVTSFDTNKEVVLTAADIEGAQVTSTVARTGEVILTEEDIKGAQESAQAAPPEVKEPTMEETIAAAHRRAAGLFEVTPLTAAEIAQAGTEPKDWADALTALNLAVRELEDSIPTRNKAVTEAAMAKLQSNATQLREFLRIRGLTV